MSDTLPDEKHVYALVASIGTNVQRLRQAIDGLRQIHDQWRDDTGMSINLIAQLTALKSNLGNIQDWLNYAIHDMHPQLLSDLELLMRSCAMLVRHLDVLVHRLRQPGHDAVDCAIKLKYAVGSRSMERLQKVARRQNEAVTLLLAACKCHATAQRKILLHKSREIRKEDSKSLNTLARSSKLNGGCIGALTQVSRMIQWLRLLFHIKLLRQEPEHVPTGEDYETEAATIRSEAIDRELQADATTLHRETKLVMLGNPDSGKNLIMRQLKVLYAEGYYSMDERRSFRPDVLSTARLVVHAIIDLLKDTGINLPSHLNQEFAILLHEVETIGMQRITPEAAKAIENIWKCPEFSTLFIRNFEIDFPQYAAYFAQEISRIASNDYIPSEADIIRLNQYVGGVKELRFNWDELDVHLFNIGSAMPEPFRKRWFHQFEGATSLMYVVDVSQYDRPYLGQPTESKLLGDFTSFEILASSERYQTSSIILLLNNFTRFREKLPHSPLRTFFPDYVPSGVDPESSARQYILRRFKDVNRNRLSIYSFWVDLDMGDNQHLYAALKKTLQHIQQRKAREEVWNASSSSMGSGSRSSSALGKVLSGKRSGTLLKDRAGTGGSRMKSPIEDDEN